MPVRRFWPRTDRWLLYANLVVYGVIVALVVLFHRELAWAARTVDGSGLLAGIYERAPDDEFNTAIDTENRS